MLLGSNSKKITKGKETSTVSKVSAQVKEANSSPNVCSICNKVFEKPQALGGHWSKAHPGESKQYRYKMLIRNSRVIEREVLLNAIAIAKKVFTN